MIPAVLMVCLGQLYFVEQDIPVPEIGEWGNLIADVLQTDVDHDGFSDLVTTHRVVFQRRGMFRKEDSVKLPPVTDATFLDVWEGDLYTRTRQGLVVYRWQDGAWTERLRQEIAWPDLATSWPEVEEEGEGQEADKPERVEALPYSRKGFLYDMEQDGQLELLIGALDGLHIFAMVEDTYTDVRLLDIFPAPELAPLDHQCLWPSRYRGVEFPGRSAHATLWLQGDNLRVLECEELQGECTRYTRTRHTLDMANRYAILAGATTTETTEPLPDCMRHMRLNGDDVLGFAGWRRFEKSFRRFQLPAYEMCISTDGGRTLQTFRTQGMWDWWDAFVDFDGDGDSDLITHASSLFQGGLREKVSRFLSARDLVHTIQIRLQDARGQFSKKPDFEGRFSIHFAKPPCSNPAFWEYTHGDMVCLDGDFNGDGYHDVLVKDEPDRLAVYLSKGRAFGTRPAAIVRLHKNWIESSYQSFHIVDLNADGQSDIDVYWLIDKGEEHSEVNQRIFLARGQEP